MSTNTLDALIDAELRAPVPAPVAQLAAALAARAKGGAVAVLYYGSNLRDEHLDGVLDFYILLDDVRAWPGSRLAAFANRLLPPNVGYFEGQVGGRALRAKYAVMSLAQFRAGMSAGSLDTTLWARFSQPCACVWTRSDADQQAACAVVCKATITAARWAAELGPPRADASTYWRALFGHTYGAELRVEKAARSDDLVERHAARYRQLLPLAWSAAGVAFDCASDTSLSPRLSVAHRAFAERRWARRQRLGKFLNLLRLAKAAFTFDGAMDYAVWKIERHSGVKIEVSNWQRRFPLLAAPGLYWRLRKRGLLK